MPTWLIVVAWLSIALGFLTAGIIVADVRAHPQRMRVMNVAWPVTALYFPLIGWWFYITMGRPMAIDAAGMKDERPKWQSVFVSATHCASGCVLGDVIAAPVVFASDWVVFGQRLYAEYFAEFALAYILGIAFQYDPIRATRQIGPREAIVDAVKADTLSLTAFEVGMFGWMAIAYFMLFPGQSLGPTSVVFWFMMQIGLIFGFITTYPANALLIKWGVKSGM